LPFSHNLIVADMNIGIFFILAVTALIVVGIIMSGWSSNSKWSLFGAIRSAAQIISYEIPAGFSIFPIVLLTGSLSMQDIIKGQGAWPFSWNLFANPFTFLAFFVFFVSALAEGNRTPFDLPEAESELVAGFATEYSGMRNLLFFMAEWGNLYVIGAIVTTLFLGGWHIPFAFENPLVQHGLEFATFFLKAYGVGVLVPIWLRWTLPRIRVDQMMAMCWKYLVPIAFVNLIGTAAWMIWVPLWLDVVTRMLMLLAAAVAVFAFLKRVVYHLEYAKLTRAHLSFNPLSGARSPG